MADENWRSGLGEPEPSQVPGKVFTPVIDYNRVFDSIIEIIDPTRGILVTSKRLDPYIMAFIDDRHVAGYREDDLGVPIIEVFEVRLLNPDGGGEE